MIYAALAHLFRAASMSKELAYLSLIGLSLSSSLQYLEREKVPRQERIGMRDATTSDQNLDKSDPSF